MRGYYSTQVEELIRRGGNAGLGFIFTTQKTAYVAKAILDLADILVVFRIVGKRHHDELKAWLLDKANLSSDEMNVLLNRIANLGVGECITLSFV